MSDSPVFFVHGNPTSSEDWEPFRARLAGPSVAVDLPGWGASPVPPGFDGTMDAHAAWLGEQMDEHVPGRFSLVVHDWGGIALVPAAQRAERIDRLVVINSVPLVAGYDWHAVGKVWRTPVLGEAFTRLGPDRRLLKLLLRDEGLAEVVARAYRPETGDAILRLYRSGDPDRLAAAGRDLHRITAPALVLWGEEDPFVPVRFAPRVAARLPGSRLRTVGGAGHWPWRDRPELVDDVVAFLETAGAAA